MTTSTIPRGAVTITRRQAHDAAACVDDTRRVLNHLRDRDGRIPRKDQRISLQDVADVLGVDGVIWCLRALGEDRLLRMFAVRCARRALRTADVRDPMSWRAVRVAQWHAQGWATSDDLDAARAAAWAVARSAEWDAAGYAAVAAAHAASQQDDVRDTAWAAAWAVAHAASQDDAQADERAAAADAAHAAEWEAQMHLLLSMAGYGGEA